MEPTACQGEARIRNGIRFGIIAIMFYLVLSLFKMRCFAFQGRFWAEEGTVFFSGVYGKSILEGLGFTFNGHLMLGSNLAAVIASRFPLEYAPLVSNWCSFAIQSIPVILVLFYRRILRLDKPGTLVFLLLLVGLPQSAEVWANSANLHFHLAFLVGIISLIEVEGRGAKVLFRILLGFASLSGIPPNFLAPVFFFLGWRTGSRERWIQFSILVAGSLVQLAILAANNFSVGDREMSFNPLVFWLSHLNHQVYSPLFGFEIAGILTGISQRALDYSASALFFSGFASIPYAVLIRRLLREKSLFPWVACSCSVVLSVLSLFSSLGSHSDLIFPEISTRYFFAPNAVFLLLLCSTFFRARTITFLFFGLVLFLSSLNRLGHSYHGPRWEESLRNARKQGLDNVAIWPKGWSIPLTRSSRSN